MLVRRLSSFVSRAVDSANEPHIENAFFPNSVHVFLSRFRLDSIRDEAAMHQQHSVEEKSSSLPLDNLYIVRLSWGLSCQRT